MVIWMLVVITFTCVGTLIFGSLEAFQSTFQVFIVFFESALGEWDNEIFEIPAEEGQDVNEFVKTVGHIYNVIFLLINLVLMLNLVIAILSNTFGNYADMVNGLYYKQLVSIFPVFDYDDNYGCLACA